MAHFPGYTYNSRYSTNPRPRPRRIEGFGCPEEILMAIHDAIESHRRQYVRTGQIHGNINTETIYIGSPSVFSCNMGFLTESPVKQELFQSVNMLSATVLDREPKFALDYADDLESFYYIIAWMSMAYTDPAVKLHPVMYPPALASWALCPDEPESVLEKQSRLIGSGFASECKRSGSMGGKRFVRVFARLLGEIHKQLKYLYNAKLMGNFEHLQPDKMTEHYNYFLDCLKVAIQNMHDITTSRGGYHFSILE